MWLPGAEEHRKSNDTEYSDPDITITCVRQLGRKVVRNSKILAAQLTSFPCPVGHKTDENRRRRCDSIGRNTQKLSMDVFIAHL